MSEKRNEAGAGHLKLLILLLGVVLCSPLQADTILLVNGSRIDGRILDQDQKRLVLQIGELGTMQIAARTIVSIEKNRRFGPDPAASSSPRPGADSRPAPSKAGSPVKTRPLLALPERPSGIKLPPELPELTGSHQQMVVEWVRDLQRHRARNRSRAERHLSLVGPGVLPYLIPVARSSFDLARISALRVLLKSPHFSSADVALEGLSANNRWVRKLSWQLIVNISGIPGDYSWDTQKLTAKRAQQSRRWHLWVQQQHRLHQQHRKWMQDQQQLRGKSAHPGR
ncbi:MAG: hypothetical protein OSB09_01675 [Planctomycetota bacterium]|nr:hypothetical protein [Planctomycetota bacterium]